MFFSFLLTSLNKKNTKFDARLTDGIKRNTIWFPQYLQRVMFIRLIGWKVKVVSHFQWPDVSACICIPAGAWLCRQGGIDPPQSRADRFAGRTPESLLSPLGGKSELYTRSVCEPTGWGNSLFNWPCGLLNFGLAETFREVIFVVGLVTF